MGIGSHCYDLHSGFDLLNSDIPERPSFVFWHPPYWNIIQYSDKCIAQKMYALNTALIRVHWIYHGFRIGTLLCPLWTTPWWSNFALSKRGRMAVLVGDIKKKGKLYSMLFELTKPGTLENVIIKAQHNCFRTIPSIQDGLSPFCMNISSLSGKMLLRFIPLWCHRRKRLIFGICQEPHGGML